MPNGGFNKYNQRTTSKFLAHPYPEPRTITVTVEPGQVIKKHSWLERTATGTVVVHSGLSAERSWKLTGSNPAVAGETFSLVIGILTYVLTVSVGKTMTPSEVVAALVSGSSSKGVITPLSGTTPYLDALANSGVTPAVNANDSSVFTLSSTDFSMGLGTGALTTTSTSISVTPLPYSLGAPSSASPVLSNREPIAGLLLYDVIAKNAAGVNTPTQAQALVSGSFWADGIKWEAEASIETITDANGISYPVTEYRTGCSTDLAYQAFVSGTEYNIVTQLAGEVEI